jgi:hypothetical protein
MPECHVQTADATAQRRGQRALDGNNMVAYGIQGFLRQPLAGALMALFTGQNFHPFYPALPSEGFGDRCIQNRLSGGPDIRSDTITLDKRYDRLVRNI